MSSERVPTAVAEVADRDPVDEAAEQELLAAGLQHLRDLLERSRVEEARRYVKELEQRWPEAERVRHYAHVLAPPKVRLRPDIPARSRKQEWQWLEEHGPEYPGCWLAIYEDRLIAAHPDRRVVTTRATEILGEERYLLFHQPGSPETK
jgi:hypothetical protein